jgi:hypothetical protein
MTTQQFGATVSSVAYINLEIEGYVIVFGCSMWPVWSCSV